MPGYISEVAYRGGVPNDFVEIAVPIGTDVSAYTIVIYNNAGAVEATISLGSLESTTGGNDVYVADSSDAGFSQFSSTNGIALVDDNGDVLQFVSFAGNVVMPSEGPALGLASTDIGAAPAPGPSLETTDGGNSYEVATANPGTIPCYGPGTLIDTPEGQRAVEALKTGDLVSTIDHGAQPIRWVRCGDVPLEEAEPSAKPVQIKAGTLGLNIPAVDLTVSPQHRILVGGADQLALFFESEVFAPAKSLTSLVGIRHMKGRKKITWHHFACDRHEVVRANGCRSESLLLGPMVVNGLNATERQEVTALFGTASTPGAALNGPPARTCLKVGEVRRMLANKLQKARDSVNS